MKKKPVLYKLPDYWDKFTGGPYSPDLEIDDRPRAPRQSPRSDSMLAQYPAGFQHSSQGEEAARAAAGDGDGQASHRLRHGRGAGASPRWPSRAFRSALSGQDSRRGTFNHRHSALIDVENEREYVPLCHLAPGQARVEIYNSELSEAAVLGFEYGYSRDYPEALVAWEAQFGDFANGAQIIIDQFIAAGEEKWGLLSGLVMLLPHGYEGQGPEHSSARIERYLQLCARDNMQVCQPSTAAQYFHLLRRQALRSWRKPLICFTPKSMLRHPEAQSGLEEFAAPASSCCWLTPR